MQTRPARAPYDDPVPPKPMKNRVIRVDDETWNAFGELCEEKGIARSGDGNYLFYPWSRISVGFSSAFQHVVATIVEGNDHVLRSQLFAGRNCVGLFVRFLQTTQSEGFLIVHR